MPVDLRPHQVKAVEELSNGKVLVGGVGTGKTITALAYFYTKVMHGVLNDPDSIKVPMDIYVFTTARKRDEFDWQREAAMLMISRERNASGVGIKLTVDSYNNIKKYEGVTGAFIILDEQRMVGSGAWTKSFLKLAKSNRWIMLSATPGDKWEDYIPLFIANGFYKTRTEFKRRHCVYSYYGKFPRLERYLEVGRLIKLRNQILVEMPYERHTTRHIHTVKVDYDKDLFKRAVKDRWHVYEDRPLKDVAELFSVMRKIVNSDVSRLEQVRTLLQCHPKVIVFYNFDYELEQLRSLAQVGIDGRPSVEQFKKDSKTECEKETLESSSTKNQTFLDTDLTSNTTSGISETSLSKALTISNSRNKTETVNVNGTNFKSGMSLPNNGRPCQNTSSTQEIVYPENTCDKTVTHQHASRSQKVYSKKSSTQPQSSSNSLIKNETNSNVSHDMERSKQLPHILGQQSKKLSEYDEQYILETSTDSLLPAETSKNTTSDPWVGTIWAKDWKPKPGEKDPRESVKAIKAKYDFDRRAKKEDKKWNSTWTNSLNGSMPNYTSTSLTGNGSDSGSTSQAEVGDENVRTPKNDSFGDIVIPNEIVEWSSTGTGDGQFQLAEWNGHKHEPVPTSDRWVYFVQYLAGAEAWNCTETDAIAFYSLTYSYRNFEQAQGRIDRLNTPYSDLHYYVLTSDSQIDRAILKALKNKQSFNEKEFVGSKSSEY